MAALFAAAAAVTVTFTVPGWRTSVLTWAVTVVVVLVWACWAWPDAGMMCSSATAVSVLLLVEVRYLTPPWLPGGFDWVLTFSYVSLAWLAVLSALTMRNRRGQRVWTAGIYQVCLLVLPVFAPIAPGPSIAGALVVFVLWYGWRGGLGRMPALLWNLRTAQKMRRLNVAAVNDSPPQWWPQLPARWVSLHDRRAGGWSRGSQPIPHLVVGVFGAVVIVRTPAGSTGSAGVPAAARAAARAVDAVEWALKTPPHMVHAVVVTDNPDQDEVWVKSVHSVGHPRTPIAVTDTKHLVATIRTVRAPHAHMVKRSPVGYWK